MSMTNSVAELLGYVRRGRPGSFALCFDVDLALASNELSCLEDGGDDVGLKLEVLGV